MVREALSRHGASGNGQLLWCRCAARLFHGRGHIVIHLFQDSQILDSYIYIYCIYIHYDSCLIGMLSFTWKPLENIYKSSTCTIDGQLPPENHTPWHSRYLGFLFQRLIHLDTRHQHKFMQGAKMLICRDQMCHGWLVCKTCHPSRIAPKVRIV